MLAINTSVLLLCQTGNSAATYIPPRHATLRAHNTVNMAGTPLQHIVISKGDQYIILIEVDTLDIEVNERQRIT